MKFIVNLTSYGKRIANSCPYAISSLLNQTIQPDKIILWLYYNEEVPEILKKLCKIGLEIRFCDELRSYKKLVPALNEFPHDVLITADDDVIYPQNWFEQLKLAFLKDPTRIYSHRARKMFLSENGELIPYHKWSFCLYPIIDEYVIFPTGVGGVLYPPSSLHHLVTNRELFMSIAPTADDVWFWAMGMLQNTKYRTISNGYQKVASINASDKGLWQINSTGIYDNQIRNIFDKFPILFEKVTRLRR